MISPNPTWKPYQLGLLSHALSCNFLCGDTSQKKNLIKCHCLDLHSLSPAWGFYSFMCGSLVIAANELSSKSFRILSECLCLNGLGEAGGCFSLEMVKWSSSNAVCARAVPSGQKLSQEPPWYRHWSGKQYSGDFPEVIIVRKQKTKREVSFQHYRWCWEENTHFSGNKPFT